MLAEKKKFSVDEQLSHLRQKGITFTYCSEEAARDYLQNNTYFFKIRAYRKNYPKHADGKEKGKYIKSIEEITAYDGVNAINTLVEVKKDKFVKVNDITITR